MSRTRARSLLGSSIAAVALLVVASPAFGAMSVTSVDVSLSTTQAGGHPDLSITTNYDGTNAQIGGPGLNPVADSPSIYEIHLPPGLNGNPLAAPTCPLATFLADRCPDETRVGTSNQRVLILAGPVERDLPGFIYNLETDNPNQAALLGVRTLGRNPITMEVVTASLVPFALTISPDDYGLDSINLERLTAVSPLVGPIRITSLGLTLDGTLRNGNHFTSNPTACTPIQVSTTTTSNDGQVVTADSDPFTPTGCDLLPFDVGLGIGLSTTRTDSPVETSVSVTVLGDDDPLRQSAVLESTVVLPPGMTVNPSLGQGLEACTDAQFAAGDRTTAATCPAASRIGTVTFVTPLFAQPFVGPVYFGTRTPGTFNRLFVDVPVPGIHVKLTGRVTLNEHNGQITTVFDGLPQLPFTDFNLTFQGGSRSVLATPIACGPHTATSNNVPFARLTDATPPNATPTSTFTTSYDGAGAPCQNVFQPWFDGVLSDDRSGADTSYLLKFGRRERNQQLGRVHFRLPAGLIGNLALDGLTKCSLADAAAGSCPASSKVGTAAVDVGVGPDPLRLPGEVFLTERKFTGDPAALSVKVPAKVGPIDLGNVIVGVRLFLRSNGGLNATSDPLPQFHEGVPIGIRLAEIDIDRAGFMRTPTACGRRSYSGDFDAVGGGERTTRAAFTLDDCKALDFGPRIAVRIGARGATRVNSHPPLVTVIRQDERGQAGISRARVLLPRAVRSNLRGIAQACSQEDFDAERCPDSAKGGRVRAISPFVPEPLHGPVWLVRRERGELPKLVAQLGGPLNIEVTGFPDVNDRTGKIVTTFTGLPDVPVTRFALRLDGGRFGYLEAAQNLCARRLVMPVTFKAWNRETQKRRPTMRVRGC